MAALESNNLPWRVLATFFPGFFARVADHVVSADFDFAKQVNNDPQRKHEKHLVPRILIDDLDVRKLQLAFQRACHGSDCLDV